jgi:hypothetical protein
MKILKEQSKDFNTLTIIGNGDGFNYLKDLILYCQHNGNIGHSFNIDADDGKFKGSWDGDGIDRIKSVFFNGEEL